MLGSGGWGGGVMGRAAYRPPRPSWSLVPPDLYSSYSSLRCDNEDSILGLLAAPPPRSTRLLPQPLVQGVVSSSVSLPRVLLQGSRPGVGSSDSVSVSFDLIFVKDPSSCWTSSGTDSPCSLPASSDSVWVFVGRGTFSVGKADGGRRSR